MVISADCTPEFEHILNDDTKLKEAYFQTFSTPDATEEVIVWLPDTTNAVQYTPENRKTVKVRLNSSLGADIGFFRTGYNYSLVDTSHKVDWLSIAYRDEKKALETMQFNQRHVGSPTDHILWVS